MNSFDHTVIVVEKMPPKLNLIPEKRQQIIFQLLLGLKDGVASTNLRHGALTEVANIFGAVPKKPFWIWRRARENFADPAVHIFVSESLIKIRCGLKQKYDWDAIRSAIL